MAPGPRVIFESSVVALVAIKGLLRFKKWRIDRLRVPLPGTRLCENFVHPKRLCPDAAALRRRLAARAVSVLCAGRESRPLVLTPCESSMNSWDGTVEIS